MVGNFPFKPLKDYSDDNEMLSTGTNNDKDEIYTCLFVCLFVSVCVS
jgi:hypothetical protein